MVQLAALVRCPLPLDLLQQASLQHDWITFLAAAQVASPLVPCSTLASLAQQGFAPPMAWHVMHILEQGGGSVPTLALPTLPALGAGGLDQQDGDLLELLSTAGGAHWTCQSFELFVHTYGCKQQRRAVMTRLGSLHRSG